MSDPLSIASGVVGIPVSLGLEVVKGLYEYCSTLKDQSSDIARIRDSLLRLHDLLDNLRRQLAARRFRSDDINILACIEGRILECKKCIVELKKVADKFNQSHNNGFRAALKAKVRRATYPFQQSTLQKLEGNVESIFQQVVFSLQLLQSEDTSSIRNHVEDTKDLLDSYQVDIVAKEIIKWLNAPDATTNFNMAHEKSQPGTGAWLINGQPFNTWLKKENSFLWLYGFAGCGKSILCSTAIETILEHQKSSQDIGVAFFFFAFDDTGKQDASALLRALILQLSGKQSSISPFSHLSNLYESCRNSTPRDKALLDCLHQLSRSFKHTYIIVDALDESPRDKHRQNVLDILTTIRGWVEPSVHLLVTSRDEVDIRDTLDPSPDEFIAVRNEASDKDIALYITQSLRNRPQLRKWKGFHGRIETTLTTQADGVFRWVDCQLREIAGCPRTEEHLDKLLSSLPQTLDDTYERMLLAIPPAFQEYARQMLMLLCCAKRHLTVQELIYGMAVDLGPTVSTLDHTDRKNAESDHIRSDNLHLDYHHQVAVFKDRRKLHDGDAILEVCPGFIELYGGHDANRDEASCVRIAHFSVQEYLKSGRIKKRGDVAQYHMQEQAMNNQATRICLAVLDKFDQSAALEANKPSGKGMQPFGYKTKFPWACYAAKFWPDHFRESKEIPPETVGAMLRFRPHALSLSSFNESRFFLGYNPLQFATHFGLPSVVSVRIIPHSPPSIDIVESS
ncbi:ankyrin repeat protein [Colletotrichum asianum]|uniref:Ankyrin repeat protein n=1 Tax=Colletotrichum asianum TaxID=702518 RepID=A0A8H3ZGC1_9PEZI|nr:ankyrin repeat protein [Colletotrichum asianum]